MQAPPRERVEADSSRRRFCEAVQLAGMVETENLEWHSGHDIEIVDDAKDRYSPQGICKRLIPTSGEPNV